MKQAYILVSLTVLAVTSFAYAQPPKSDGLVKEGDTFKHEASKSSLKVNKEWELVDTRNTVQVPHVALRKAFGGVDVIVTWTKLQDLKFDEAVQLEVEQLAQSYGKDKVAKKEPITIDNKSVAVIELAEGPDRNSKQAGLVYLIDAGPDAKERWKVKMRVILDKSSMNSGLKSINELLKQFQW
ncbi:MAG: hypothetical protein JNJ77_10335 [Planctomycetia bacterium]|nr:hypothetical protein [Planctomycetia bacterium]